MICRSTARLRPCVGVLTCLDEHQGRGGGGGGGHVSIVDIT